MLGFLILLSSADCNENGISTLRNEMGKLFSSTVMRLAVRSEIRLKEKVVGTYELRDEGQVFRGVFLDDGTEVDYTNGKKIGSNLWRALEGEVCVDQGSNILIFRINPEGSLTRIAYIDDEGRKVLPREKQKTFIKIH